ncbi:ABC transporter substrate-binding protein [Actinoplanes sp. NPDC023936]|uniref:ABC transporter substrate-binding protein n=1 Tax=Actinoplanes sp. NPDC023936 TaxID=3154910 RepID=UPI0033F6E3AC
MRLGRAALALTAAAALLVTAACGKDDATGASAADGTLTVTIGAVPSIDYGVIKVGEAQGFFAKHGVAVEVATVDSGPAVVTGVVAGQYDLGWTGYAPVLLAVAAGNTDLRLVSNIGLWGAKGDNGGILVRRDSGITSFAGLAGRKVATNAPRSVLTLTLQAAIAKAGGDPARTELVTLPFAQIAKAVADKQVDAGVTVAPHQTKALQQFPQLTDLGDAPAAVLEPGSPSGAVFARKDPGAAEQTAIDRFRTAIKEALVYADSHPDEVTTAGAALAGLSPADAAALPKTDYRGDVTAAQIAPLAALMKQYGWITTDIDLASFVGA